MPYLTLTTTFGEVHVMVDHERSGIPFIGPRGSRPPLLFC